MRAQSFRTTETARERNDEIQKMSRKLHRPCVSLQVDVLRASLCANARIAVIVILRIGRIAGNAAAGLQLVRDAASYTRVVLKDLAMF